MPDGIDKLVEKIGAQLGAVEEVIDVGKKYEGIVVAKVIKCEKHPNADKLSVCLIDDGGTARKVKRNKNGLVEVVCGAPNAPATLAVAYIPPGVAVPSTIDEEPLVLEAREIRGIVSNGMIASARELDIGDDHSGIVELEVGAKPGTPLVKALPLEDYVIDIENKMFTHRPDLFGQLGIARELAGIQGHVFKSPDWYKENPQLPKPNGAATHKLTIKNQVPKLVPRFSSVVIKDVKVGPSPLWLRARLSNVGVKSINNIVDITNFLMLETAQPLHAYDYDKLTGGNLGTRLAKAGEELTVLGGKKLKLGKDDIVITSADKPIGLGGVMGGVNTEVGDQTKNIAIEVANFDMNTIRKSAMTHGLFTEAATRFTKNQSPRQNLAVLVKAMDEVKKIAGGRQASKITDDKHFQTKTITVDVTAQFINECLGEKLSAVMIKKLLENVEFGVKGSGDKLNITVPFWRTDIEIPEDIVEEVGRLYGYDHLPLELPTKDLTPAPRNESLDLKSRIRQIMLASGANEALTYSFVHGKLLEQVGQDPKSSYHIKNALSPDLQYYRQTLAPSLLEKVHPNIKAGFDEFALFEIGIGHYKDVLDEEKLPLELGQMALVIASKESRLGAPFYAARKYCEFLLSELGFSKIELKPPQKSTLHPSLSYYELERSANIYADGKLVGRLGEFDQSTRDSLKLPKFCAGFEIYLPQLDLPSGQNYQPINRFPAIEQDICLRASTQTSYAELIDLAETTLAKISKEHGYNYMIKPVDIYQRPSDEKHKQTTWRISLSHPEKTLKTAEANEVLDKIAAEAKKKFKAERV